MHYTLNITIFLTIDRFISILAECDFMVSIEPVTVECDCMNSHQPFAYDGNFYDIFYIFQINFIVIFTEPSCSSNSRKNYAQEYDINSCNNNLERNCCTDRTMYPTSSNCRKNYTTMQKNCNDNCDRSRYNNCQNYQELSDNSNDNLKGNNWHECKCRYRGKIWKYSQGC